MYFIIYSVNDVYTLQRQEERNIDICTVYFVQKNVRRMFCCIMAVNPLEKYVIQPVSVAGCVTPTGTAFGSVGKVEVSVYLRDP